MNGRRLLTTALIAALFIFIGLFITTLLPRLPYTMLSLNVPKDTVSSFNQTIYTLCSIGVCTVSVGISPQGLPVISKGFMLLFSLTVVGLTLSIYYYLRERLQYYVKLREQIIEFLPIAASLAQTKTTTTEILRMAANLMEDPLRTLLLRMIHLITLGEDPEEAAKIITEGAPVEVKAVFDAIAIGAKSGGHFSEVLERSNEYFMEVLRMERSVKDKLSEYKAIALLASVTFTAASIVALKLISSVVAGLGTLPSASQVDIRVMESALFITSVVISIMASLVIGKVIEGSTLKSMRYIAITMMLNGLAFSLYQLLL